MMAMPEKTMEKLTVLMLVLLNFSAVVGLRGLPLMAGYGLSSIFFYALAAVCFLIPVSFICAELATGWPKSSGIYGWVKEAFGERMGFLAVWFQWAPNVIWYSLVLSFFAATISYLIPNSGLAGNQEYVAIVTIIVYWIATYVNLHGFNIVKKLSSSLTVIGVMIPVLLLTLFALDWIRLGNAPQTALDLGAIIPTLEGIGSLVFAISVFASFSGMEVHAVRANNLKNVAKDYPKTVFLSALLIFFFFVIGTVSISVIVPHSNLNLLTGLIEAFKDFLSTVGKMGLLPIFVAMICLGLFGQVVSWISGPSKSLLIAAENGNLPPFFKQQNKNGVHINILLMQGTLVTIIALLFLLFRSTELFYWFLTDVYAHLYLLMYMLLFAAAIKLRYSQPNVKRSFTVPFGNAGMWLFGGVGFLAALSGFLVGFFPPTELPKSGVLLYEAATSLGVLAIAIIPIIIYAYRDKWNKNMNKKK
jgi:amino acid transporter